MGLKKKVNGQWVDDTGVDVTVDGTSVMVDSTAVIASTGNYNGDASSADFNPMATRGYVATTIDNLPKPMIWTGVISITAYSSDPTKCSIIVSAPASASDIKKGYTYKVSFIAASPAYTGPLEIGDTLIAAKNSPKIDVTWIEDTDWNVVPSGDETGFIIGLASGTIENQLISFGANGYTAKNSGVTVETTMDGTSDAKVPTSKSVRTNTTKTAVLTDYAADNPPESDSPVASDTINQAIRKLDSRSQTNRNNILAIQAEQIAQNADIATLRLALDTKIYGIRIDKQDVNPDTRVTYLYDAVGMTPAYMDFNSGTFNYGSWADIWFVKNNRPVALKFDGTVDYELDHTDFTKKLDGTASDVSDPDYDGNFMSEMPTVYVKRWEDSRYNYIAFSDNQVNSDFLAQAHTNANGTVNSAIYLPMFKGWKDSNNKLRSLMGTYPTGDTTGANEVTYASNNGAGWQIWDKAKIDLLMDLIMLITKSTNCRAKIGNGDCQTYNESDTTNYGKMKSGYETDGTTRSASAQFYGSEGTGVTNYGKHHMIAFYIEDLWGNRWDRCFGFNLVNNVYKVKMTPPYVLDSDSTYQSLSAIPPSSTEGWLKNVSSGVYGDVPTEVGASNTSGFANYFYKNVSGNCLSFFGGGANFGLEVGRYWRLGNDSGSSSWNVGGSPCYTAL